MRQTAAGQLDPAVQKLHGGLELSYMATSTSSSVGHCEAWNLYGAADEQLLVMVVGQSFDLGVAACLCRVGCRNLTETLHGPPGDRRYIDIFARPDVSSRKHW